MPDLIEPGDPSWRLPDGTHPSSSALLRVVRTSRDTWKKRAEESAAEESRLRAIISLLLRAYVPNACAELSTDVLQRLRDEGLELEYVLDPEKREILVRLASPEQERPPSEPGEPLGRLKGE